MSTTKVLTPTGWKYVSVGAQGPPGPPGQVTGSTYTYNQGAASAHWVITHNLGFNPSVVVIDSTGAVVEGDIVYTSTNVVTLNFSGAFSGSAYLS